MKMKTENFINKNCFNINKNYNLNNTKGVKFRKMVHMFVTGQIIICASTS